MMVVASRNCKSSKKNEPRRRRRRVCSGRVCMQHKLKQYPLNKEKKTNDKRLFRGLLLWCGVPLPNRHASDEWDRAIFTPSFVPVCICFLPFFIYFKRIGWSHSHAKATPNVFFLSMRHFLNLKCLNALQNVTTRHLK